MARVVGKMPAKKSPFKKDYSGATDAYKALEARADHLLGKKTSASERLAQLVRARDEAAAKVYSGAVTLKGLSDVERNQFTTSRETLSNTVTSAFLNDYARLAARGATERLKPEAQLLDLGMELIEEVPLSCPLCGQALNESLREHISQRHEDLRKQVGEATTPEDARARVETALRNVRVALDRHRRLLEGRSGDLLRATDADNKDKVGQLFGKENAASWEIVQSTARDIAPFLERLQRAVAEAENQISVCEGAVRSRNEEVLQAEALARSFQGYLEASDLFDSHLIEVDPSLIGPARLLQQAIDRLAGTAELTLIIELLEGRRGIERTLRVREVLDGLKELKKHVDQTVGETMKAAIDTELTKSVMNWYGMIRTKGDPDVHFSGFAMEKTKAGDFKSRRLKVKAQSYGVELASAVSSLSESKLNALGLCVSIASALRSPGPWEFLVLDDPIQSWDDEHEIQFIEVIRALADQEGKQRVSGFSLEVGGGLTHFTRPSPALRSGFGPALLSASTDRGSPESSENSSP